MKLIDALHKVIKTKENTTFPKFDRFCVAAGVDSSYIRYDKVAERLKAYWLQCWLCTDTRVGYQAIYLDDVLVAYTSQNARKNDYDIYFIGKLEANKTNDYIRSLIESADYIATDVDLNVDIDEICSAVNILLCEDYSGFYNGRPVTVLRTLSSPDRSYCIEFIFDDTKETCIGDLSNYTFPLRVNKDLIC